MQSLQLPVAIAVAALSARSILRRLVAMEELAPPSPLSRRSPEDVLLAALESWGFHHFGRIPLHQVEAAARLLVKSEPGSPCGAGGRTLGRSLALTAGRHLVCTLYQWRQGQVAIRPEASLEHQWVTGRILPDQLLTLAWATESLPGETHRGLRPALSPRTLRDLLHGPLLPSPARPQLERVARHGLAEVHRHDSLARLPTLTWVEFLRSPRRLVDKVAHDGDWEQLVPSLPGDRLRQVVQRVRVAALLRLLILSELHGAAPKEARTLLREILGLLSPPVPGLAHSRLEMRVHRATGLFAPFPIPGSRSDPATLLPGGEADSLIAERALLLAGWRRLAARDRPPAWFEHAWHAYLVLQNLTVRVLVHPRSKADGFERFGRYYASSPLHDLDRGERVAQVVQARRTGRVRWLELRVAPSENGKTATKVKRIVDAVDTAHGNRPASAPRSIEALIGVHAPQPRSPLPRAVDELGVLFHFIRRRDRSRPHEATRALPLRHAGLRNRLWTQAATIRTALQRRRLRRHVVGLDVANDETVCPIEVFAPVLRSLRRPFLDDRTGSPIDLADADSGFGPRSLVLACHAGEDFRHVLSGLRMIVETLEFTDYQAGDRLGHALALGVRWRPWVQRLGNRARLPRGEWLDDLVVFRHSLQRIGDYEGVRAEVDNLIARHARACYGEHPGADLLYRAWTFRREDPLWIDAVEGRVPPPVDPHRRTAMEELRHHRDEEDSAAWELWVRYHRDPAVRRNTDEVITVPLDPDWADAVEAVQDALLARLADHDIAIEINPSSNRSIGPIDDMTDHPVFRWRPPGRRDERPAPPVLVGTDDPAVFSTELVHEYDYLAAAAARRGHTAEEIEAWLRELRAMSLEYCRVGTAESR